jgi:negative regulator of sigma E activity
LDVFDKRKMVRTKTKKRFWGIRGQATSRKNIFSHCLSKGLFQLQVFVKTKMKSAWKDTILSGKKSVEF